MTLLSDLDCGGDKYNFMPRTPIGTCATPAGTEIKECNFDDTFELKAGVWIAVQFTYANTYGDGSTTYPKLRIGSTDYAIKTLKGAYTASGAWDNGETVIMLFDGTDFMML